MTRTTDPGASALEVEHDSRGRAFEVREVVCPTCKVDDADVLGYRGGVSHRHALGIRSRIVRCRRCDLIYPNPFPQPVDPDAVYTNPEEYFGRHDQDARVEEYSVLARTLQSRTGKQTPRVLDIGSGRGDFIHAARQVGLDSVVGVEFAEAMVDHAREQFDVDLFHGTLEDFAGAWDGRPFDAVVLNAILEHVPDPDRFVELVAQVTFPGSLLYLDIPHEPHLAARLLNFLNRLRRRDEVFNIAPTWPPFHVYGFNRTALETLLNKHGFRVQDVRIWCDPRVFNDGSVKDRVASTLATTVNRLANSTGTAGNMFVWAARV